MWDPRTDILPAPFDSVREAEVLRKARVMMHENNTGLKTEYVDMTGDDAEEEGMVCGGTIEVLLEPLWN